MKGFFDYIPGNTGLHKLNPVTKIMLSFIICIACFISKNPYFLLGIIGLNLLLGAYAGAFSRAVRLLKGLLKISVLLFLIQLLIIQSGEALIALPLHLSITDNGLRTAINLVLRLVGATIPLALMLSITRMNDLSNALVTRVHVPYKYAFTLTTAIRFIPVFTEEMAGIMEAQISRGVEFDTRNILKKMRLILPLCVPLLITSVKKADASAISAELRGFQLRTVKSCYKTYPFHVGDAAAFFFGACLIMGAVLLNLTNL